MFCKIGLFERKVAFGQQAVEALAGGRSYPTSTSAAVGQFDLDSVQEFFPILLYVNNSLSKK